MDKVVIVMTYFQRQQQLTRTLLSLKGDNFRVVIVDDNSPDDIILPEVDYEITVLKILKKQWTNPEPAYNLGIKYAMQDNPKIIILQNAECYHVGDVIGYARTVTDESYISFGCYSMGKEEGEMNNEGATSMGQSAWYNHPIYRPVGYDFCSAITAKNLRKLNGYDERLSNGCGRGDNYLLDRIKMLGLKIEITSYPYVVHQWHYTPEVLKNKTLELIMKNRAIYAELIKERNYKAVHLYKNIVHENFSNRI